MAEAALGDVADLIRGITFKPSDKCEPGTPGSVVCMRTKNIQSKLEQADVLAVPEYLVKNEKKFIYEGDILVSSANSWNLVGKCCRVENLKYRSTAGGFISVLRPQNANTLDPRYLYRWFSLASIQNTVRSFGNQTTNISNLNHKRTLNLKVPLPPLAEQKRIAGILDAADKLRAKRRESIAQLDTLLQSTFLDMFGDPVTNPMGWEAKKFGDLVANSFRNGLSPSTKGQVDGEVLTLSAITRGRFDGSAKKAAKFDRAPSLGQQLSKDTFLICRGNGNRDLVGAGAFPDHSNKEVSFPDTMIGATVDSDLLAPAYLESVWRSRLVRRQIASGARTTNGTYKVNQKLLNSIVIPLPPIKIQRRFEGFVQTFREYKNILSAHEIELDTLFASLQQRAFNGTL